MDIILEGIKKSVDDELLSIFGNEEMFVLFLNF